ncbi:MAG: type II toxin-antitoxin system RelE/ParE family toxin [Flavobacterium sp.]|jgi:plasmid stabilization system protein ParE|uniref:type II toxin-antitoxin system RelE/ParE family toxin n=1 Tax=Flavobacterium sp. TaxID=239 RepID=UPI003BA638DF
MEYKIVVSTLALEDIEKITDFYESINIQIVINFLDELEETYKTIQTNPYFQVKYKSYRSIPLKIFPFILIFEMNEDLKEVRILSCFHTSRSTKKYPK